MRGSSKRAAAWRGGAVLFLLGLVLTLTLRLRADLIEMINGDRYSGTIISLNSTGLVFQSETQGKITLPRPKVARVTLGNAALAAVSPPTNAPAGSPAGFATIATNTTDLVNQLRQGSGKADAAQVKDLLSSAGPEATRQFNQTLAGLMSGKLSIADIRAQARESVAQIEEARGELGDDVGSLLDGYLGILQGFLRETEPAAKPAIVPQVPRPGTNQPARTAPPVKK